MCFLCSESNRIYPLFYVSDFQQSEADSFLSGLWAVPCAPGGDSYHPFLWISTSSLLRRPKIRKQHYFYELEPQVPRQTPFHSGSLAFFLTKISDNENTYHVTITLFAPRVFSTSDYGIVTHNFRCEFFLQRLAACFKTTSGCCPIPQLLFTLPRWCRLAMTRISDVRTSEVYLGLFT